MPRHAYPKFDVLLVIYYYIFRAVGKIMRQAVTVFILKVCCTTGCTDVIIHIDDLTQNCSDSSAKVSVVLH